MSASVKFDKIVSVIFHPVFIPVYGLAIIFSADTPFGFLPWHVKKLIYLIVIVNNVFLPLSVLPFLMQMNFISSYSLVEREERAVPLIIAAILYATSSYIIYRFPVPHFLKAYIFSVFLVSLIITIVNFKWKISLHSVGAGALMALLFFLSFELYSALFWYVVCASIIVGIVLSARLRLNLHSPSQVWWGFFSGLFMVIIFLFFLQQFS